MPAHPAVVQVLLLRHHVAHRSPLQCRQLLLVQCRVGRRHHLRFRLSRQRQFCLHQEDRRKRPCRLRIKANGRANLGIPELRFVAARAPRPLHNTQKAIRPLHRGRESLPSQHHHLGSRCDRCRGSTAGQRDLRILVGHQIRIHRSHRRIRSLVCLRLCRACCAGQAELNKKHQRNEPERFLPHGDLQ